MKLRQGADRFRVWVEKLYERAVAPVRILLFMMSAIRVDPTFRSRIDGN
jgi:hypothetical protein